MAIAVALLCSGAASAQSLVLLPNGDISPTSGELMRAHEICGNHIEQTFTSMMCIPMDRLCNARYEAEWADSCHEIDRRWHETGADTAAQKAAEEAKRERDVRDLDFVRVYPFTTSAGLR